MREEVKDPKLAGFLRERTYDVSFVRLGAAEGNSYRGLMGDFLTIEIIKSNITHERVDAIVNAANKDLNHGAGVAWAIRDAAGEEI